MFYVYKITNLINGKIYIGKTGNMKRRWKSHLAQVKAGPDKNDKHRRFQYLHRAIAKHGAKNFKVEIIIELDTEKEALNEETKFIKSFNSNDREVGYNLTAGGEGASGYKHSEKNKKRMSELKQGVYDGEKNPFWEKKHTEDVKNMLSKLASQKTGNKNPFFGKRHKTESIELMKLNHHNKPRRLTSEQISQLRKEYKTGKHTYKTLGKKYDLSTTTIKNIMTYKGAYLKDKPLGVQKINNRQKISTMDIENIYKLYNTGKYTQKELATIYGVTQTTISYVLQKITTS